MQHAQHITGRNAFNCSLILILLVTSGDKFTAQNSN
jgi:hypothetical protein